MSPAGWRPPRATTLIAVGVPLVALAWVLLPVILGDETFFLRDLFAAQLGLRQALAEGLAAGHVPLVDAHRLGQPLAGNPNAVGFYPTAALHLVAPLLWAFSAHLWIHLFVAPFAAAWMARELGLSRRAAWAAGIAFAFSGYYASQLVFLNLIAGVTLAPALAAATLATLARARRGRRRAAAAHAAAAGALWGLVLLGGDPMTAALAAGVAAAAALPEPIAAWRARRSGAAAEKTAETEAATEEQATEEEKAEEARAGASAAAEAAVAAEEATAAAAGGEAPGRHPLAVGGRLAARGLLAGVGLLAVGLVGGTLLALPQLVELMRVLPASARAQRGFSEGVRLAGSLDPRQALEWLLPFCFGRPDLLGPGSPWGQRYYQGGWAFLYTLYPGFAAVALVAAAGLPWRRRVVATQAVVETQAGAARPGAATSTRAAAVGAGLAVVGAFFALGAFNPVAVWVLTLPLFDVLRFPTKLWLLAALGLSLLAGVGFERALVAGEPAALRRALAAVLALGAVVAGVWTALAVMPARAAGLFLAVMPEGADRWLADAEVARWSRLALVSAATAAAIAGLLVLARRRPVAAGALLVALHATTQLYFLAPVRATDAALPYTLPSRLLAVLPADEVIVHGAAQDLFGEGALRDAVFPEPRAAWIFRRGFHELYPMGGGLWGRRYDLVTSPEALDPLPTRQAFYTLEAAPDDRRRLRLLAAWGTERLVLDRPLADADRAGLAEPVASAPSFRRRVWVYRLVAPAPPVHLAERVTTVDTASAAARHMAGERFRPGADAVVVTRGPGAPGEGTALPGTVLAGTKPPDAAPRREAVAPAAPPGVPRAVTAPPDAASRVQIVAETSESLVADVDSPAGGLLVWRRAWLPIYRATVGGRPASPIAANIHHLAVPVPPGRHRVALATDRRPLTRATWAAALGALTLLLLPLYRPRRSPTTPA